MSTEVVAVFRLGWSPNRPPDKPTVRFFKRRGPRPSQMHGRAGNIRRIIGKSQGALVRRDWGLSLRGDWC